MHKLSSIGMSGLLGYSLFYVWLEMVTAWVSTGKWCRLSAFQRVLVWQESVWYIDHLSSSPLSAWFLWGIRCSTSGRSCLVIYLLRFLVLQYSIVESWSWSCVCLLYCLCCVSCYSNIAPSVLPFRNRYCLTKTPCGQNSGVVTWDLLSKGTAILKAFRVPFVVSSSHSIPVSIPCFCRWFFIFSVVVFGWSFPT